MSHDLIERYVYAVTKRLPYKQREDVSMELRGLIEDMLSERCVDILPAEKDIRVVLTELGTPQELAAQYDPDRDKCLIGQPYYRTYCFVLKIVLLSVVAGVTISNGILQMLEPQGWLAWAATWLSMLYNSMLAAFAIVTLLFAFFCRRGIRLTESFNFDDLPPVPKKQERISKWESIAGICFCALFVVLFVFTPEVFCVIREGVVISLFNVEAIRESWFLVAAFAACGIARETVQLMEGRYSRKVMAVSLITNGLSAVLAICWLVGFDLMNPVFLSNMQTIFAGEDAIVYRMFANFDLFFLGVLLFALVLDSVDVTVRTLRK